MLLGPGEGIVPKMLAIVDGDARGRTRQEVVDHTGGGGGLEVHGSKFALHRQGFIDEGGAVGREIFEGWGGAGGRTMGEGVVGWSIGKWRG